MLSKFFGTQQYLVLHYDTFFLSEGYDKYFSLLKAIFLRSDYSGLCGPYWITAMLCNQCIFLLYAFSISFFLFCLQLTSKSLELYWMTLLICLVFPYTLNHMLKYLCHHVLFLALFSYFTSAVRLLGDTQQHAFMLAAHSLLLLSFKGILFLSNEFVISSK